MTQMKQARLSAAVAAVMGVSFAPLSAQAQDVLAPHGYSATGAGQAVIIPYYTVSGGWNTTIGMTNTTDAALLVKVRLHEAYNSRDVLDFSVMLSPNDVWSAALQPNDTTDGAQIVIPNGERSCTSPVDLGVGRDSGGNVVFELSADAYTNTPRGSNADGGPTTLERTQEGYVEFLVMGECRQDEPCYTASAATNNDGTAPGIGYLVEHIEKTEDGVSVWRPRDCSAADAMGVAHVQFPGVSQNTSFASLGRGTYSSDVPGNLAMRAGAPGWLGPVEGVKGSQFDGTPTGAGWGGVRHPSPLRGSVQYTHFGNGLGGGAEAMHLESVVCSGDGDAMLLNDEGVPASGMDSAGNGTGTAKAPSETVPDCNWDVRENNLIATAQFEDFFLEPTIATMPMGLWNSQGLSVLEDRFTWSEAFSDWSNNPITQTYTDWVVNFPTKGFHVDRDCSVLQANWNGWRVDGTGYTGCTPETAPLAPFNNTFNGDSEISFSIGFWDREERTAAGAGTSVSPGGTSGVTLPYETNVITFNSTVEQSILGSNIAQNYDVKAMIEAGNVTGSSLGGWASLIFGPFANNAAGSEYLGLPVYAINFTVQQVSSQGAPFPTGFVTKHGYNYAKP